MNYIWLMGSILLEASKTLMLTNFSKTALNTDADIYKFNTFMYFGSLLVILCTGIGDISVFSVLTALIFAVVTAASQIFFLMALRCGPVSFTAFLQGVSLVIPVIVGILFMGDSLSVWQIISFPVLLVSLALVFNLSKEKLSGRWTLLAVLSMLTMGLVGVVQTVHQGSEHREELSGFLIFAFLYAIILNFILWKATEKKEQKTFPLKGKALVLALLSGVFMGIVNIVNLYLAGVMPKAIFFPIANGGLTVVTLIGSAIFFKEILNKKQWIGIMICIAALCVLGI